MSGLSTTGNISLGLALVAGKKRVPMPATGNTALVSCFMLVLFQMSFMKKLLAQARELIAHFAECGSEISHAFFLLLNHGGRCFGHKGFVAQLS